MKNLLLKRREPEKRKTISSYREGAEGFIAWAEEFCYIPIYPEGSDIAVWTRIGDLPVDKNPETNRSYKDIWEAQKEIAREALIMDNGRFKHRLIIFCWPRGEGKSLFVCLIVLWKFFNWPRQQIMLGANSKEQVKFVHFDIMSDIIINSPVLYRLVGGKRNIQEKNIFLKDKKGIVRSLIRSISSFSGIVSNISNYTFSEMFDMKNPKFFVQLDGSIRNMPNSFGLIDSTVSAKTHVLYQLYQNTIEGKTKGTYFSYRCSRTGDSSDYWNPNMTTDQLEDYRAKFPFGEFERYFLNLWSAGVGRVFSEEMIEGMSYLGADGVLLDNKKIQGILETKNNLYNSISDLSGRNLSRDMEENKAKIDAMLQRLYPVENVYMLKDRYGSSKMATLDELNRLEDMFDTHFAVMAGTDFGDPYATKGLARTFLIICAKGLPGSRSNPYIYAVDNAASKYLYIVLFVKNVQDHSLDVVKDCLDGAGDEFDGIDTLCSERYGAWDVSKWCEDRDILFEPVYPNYGRQTDAFKELYLAVKEGRVKCPPLAVPGSKKEDVLREEMGAFDHDLDKKWFGSPEKTEKYGIQDDSVFALGWCLYGGRMLNTDDFRIRKGMQAFGMFSPQKGLVGNYA